LKTSKRDVAFASKKSVAAIKKIKLPAESIKEQGAVFQYLVVCQKLPCREDSPKVSIVVLNWNRKADTLECLKSLKTIKYDNFEVVVVDNGSTDDSVQAIQQSFPDVSLIETGENLGYAGGNNAGLRHALNAGAKWVLVLNNDTVVDPMILRRFIQAGELIPDAGVLGAKVYFYSEPKRIWHAGATCLDGLAHFRSLGYGCLDNGQDFSSIREVDYVYGCAFFIATETIKIVGLFDEKFFLTHEDVDWCLRAKRLGLKCIFVPEAHVWHKCSVSFGGGESPAYKYFLTRGKLLWARKNLEPIQRCHVWVSVFRELFGDYFGSLSLSRWSRSPQYRYSRQVYWLISHWIQEFRENYARPEFRAKLYGLRDYLLGRFGYEEETIRTLK